MKAVVFYGPDTLRVEARPTPTPEAGEALLRVDVAGICMTDLHILQGHFTVRPPRILGHELAGVVEAVGPGVEPAWVGKAVGVSPARFCGQCVPCRTGAAHLCTNFECLGNTHDGGFAEYAIARVDQLVPLNGMPVERAVWMEPLACVLHAIEAAALPAGAHVLISGAGTLGRLMVQALRLTRDARIAVADPNPLKVNRAIQMGAETGWIVPREGDVDSITAPIRAWADGELSGVIETSGKPIAFERALIWATPRTRIVLFGVSDPHARAAIPPSMILARELVITAASGMTQPTFDAAGALLADTRLAVETLVAETVDLDNVPAALARMQHSGAGKILVQPVHRG